MASSTSKLAFRIVLAALLLLALFYVGRISQIMLEAQRSVGWFNDESDSGIHENRDWKWVFLEENVRVLMLNYYSFTAVNAYGI
ncbi:hypothetical protein Gohar_010498 [Gossypium harknessii]|uniref:Uncharacterized protein n=1 Tax=Gossypium harknessii TaxID=34285 RepID=A0A7J9GR27_9ROSI|nr:hypothetical protein [Gossypium harknessii]